MFISYDFAKIKPNEDKTENFLIQIIRTLREFRFFFREMKTDFYCMPKNEILSCDKFFFNIPGIFHIKKKRV